MTAWLGALALDLIVGEPPEALHPVAWMGRLIGGMERLAPRTPLPQARYGLGIAALPAVAAAMFGLVPRVVPRGPLRMVVGTFLLKTTFSLRGLLDASTDVEAALHRHDQHASRDALRSLVSRERSGLDEAHIVSAAIESLAENLTDAYVAPLFWHAVGGLPAALAYRAVNTADAMVGYHGRYEHLGKASARFDDVLNIVPARLSAVALAGAAALVGLDAGAAVTRGRRDHDRTESPNAGWTMATAAGALGIWLEKIGHYRLGEGRAPAAEDIVRARRLVVTAAMLSTAVVAAVVKR